jgi:hypothetical protein
VALSGDTALIGAHWHTVGGQLYAGAEYVFTRHGRSWSQQAELTASDPAYYDNFGWSVALSGDTALIGAPFKNSFAGSAYVFTGSGTSWSQRAEVSDPDAATRDYFGQSVALSGHTALIGAPGVTVGGESDAGTAYVDVLRGR